MGDGCINCKNNMYSKGKKYLINAVHDMDMVSHQLQIPCLIKLNLEYLKLLKWLMIYDIATSKKGLNSICLAERYGVKCLKS